MGDQYDIGIGLTLNTNQFSRQLKAADTDIRSTQGIVDRLKDTLENDWSAEGFKRAQEHAQKAADQTRQRVEAIKNEIELLNREGGPEKFGREIENLEKKLRKADDAAQDAEKQLTEVNSLRFDHIQQQLDGVDSALDKVAKGAAVLGGAMLAAGGAAVKLGLDAIASADDIATTAEQLGVSTEQLQKYQYMAMQTDVSNESLSKAFVKLNGDVGNLAIGIKDNGNKALLQLIGDYKNLDGTVKSSEQVFYEVVNALQGMNSEAERAGYVNQIFGEKMGKDLNPMLNKSVSELQALEKEFYNVGFVTDENIAKFGDMDNRLNETRAIIADIASDAAVDLLPAFEEFANLIRDNKEELKDFAITTVNGIANVAKTVYEMRGAVAAAVAVFAMLKAEIAILSAITAAQKAMEGYTIATKAAEIAQKALAAAQALTPWGMAALAIGLVVSGLVAYKLATGDAKDENDRLSESIKKLDERYTSATEAIDDNLGKQTSNLDIVESQIKRYDELNGKVNKTTAEKQELSRVVAEINRILPDAIGKINQETGAYETQTSVLYGLIDARRTELELIAYRDKAVEAQKGLNALRDKTNYDDLETDVTDKYKSYLNAENVLSSAKKDPTKTAAQVYYAGLDAENAKKAWNAAQAAADAYNAEVDKLTADINKYTDYGKSAPATTTAGAKNAGNKATGYKGNQDVWDKAYDDDVKESKALLDAGQIGQADYLKKRFEAEEAYLKEGTDKRKFAHLENLALEKKYNEDLAKEADRAAKESAAAAKQAEKDAETDRKNREKQEAEAAQAKINAYNSVHRQKQYERDKDIISEKAYYDAIEEAMNAYLTDGSEARMSAEVEIYSGRKKLRDEAYREELDALKKQNDGSLKAEGEYLAAQEALRDKYYAAQSKEYKQISDDLAAQREAYNKKSYDAQRLDVDWDNDLRIWANGKTIEGYEAHYKALEELRDKYLVENSEAWRKATRELMQIEADKQAAILKAQQEFSANLQSELERQKQAQQNQLKQINDTYDATVAAIEKALEEKKKLYQEELKEVEKSLREQSSLYKAQYDEQRKQIDSELNLQKKRLNTIIDAIDEEIAARRRLRETEGVDDKVAQAQKALAAAQTEFDFARNDYEKEELKKEVERRKQELAKAIQDRDDTLFYQQKSDQKDAIKKQMAVESDAADAAKAKAEAAMVDLIAKAEEEAKAATERVNAAIADADQWSESSKAAAGATRDAYLQALADLNSAASSSKDYMYMTEAERAVSELVNQMVKDAKAQATSIAELTRRTQEITNVNNYAKTLELTVNTGGQTLTKGMMLKLMEDYMEKM